MKKFTITGAFIALLFVTVGASAATNRQWSSIPKGFGVTEDLSAAAGIEGRAIFKKTSNNSSHGFLGDWDYKINRKPSITDFVTGLSEQNGVPAIGGARGAFTPKFSFQPSLAAGSHSLIIAEASVSADEGIDELLQPKDNIEQATTPIPAAIWLFGSSLVGFGGLSMHRKSLLG